MCVFVAEIKGRRDYLGSDISSFFSQNLLSV